MAAEQSMKQAMMQAAIEATKAGIMAVRETYNLVSNARPMHTTPRLGDPTSKQPVFDWKAILGVTKEDKEFDAVTNMVNRKYKRK